MAGRIQTTYAINPGRGFVGSIAEPNSPMRIESGVLELASGDPRASATPAGARPGDAVYYDNSANAWRVAHTAATLLLVEGILTFPSDTVANEDSFVVYADGAQVEVATMGVLWVTAGGASERGDILEMQTDDWKYDNEARETAIAQLVQVPIVNYSTVAATDGDIIKAAIGYGRVI